MKEQPRMRLVLWAAIAVVVSSTTTTHYDPNGGVPHSGGTAGGAGATTTRHAGPGPGPDGPEESFPEETTVTTTTNCGCDICWVETKTHTQASEVSWDIVNTVGGATVCTSPSLIDHSTILSSCCLSRSGSYTVTCRDSGGDGWSALGFIKIDGVALCSDGTAFSTKANEFPLPSPFTITAGSACYADLDCLRSSRRRRSNPDYWEMGDGEVEDCTVEINPRSGPVSLSEGYFQWGDVLTLNGVRYENNPPPEGIRPYGNFTYSTTQAMYSDWTLCVPPLTGTRTGGGGSTATNTAVARDALNGLGKFFDFKWEWDQKTIARLACEASYGEGGCVIGQCGCFSYYYRLGAPSCSCSKAVGEGEWIFANSGCTNVSSDYGGEGDSIVGASGFARVRSYKDCTQTSWRLASKDYSTRTLNHHVAVDLRASEYTHPATGWTNLVPTSNDVTYAANDGSSLGDGYGSGPAGPHFDLNQLKGSRMNLKATMAECTYSAWIYIPNGDYIGTIINDKSYNTREFRISQIWSKYYTLHYSNPPDGVWNHVAQVWQGPYGQNGYFKWTAYINGEALEPEVDIQLTQQSTRRLEFGGEESDTPGYPNAFVSDIAVFDRVLTAFEVLELYVSGRPSDSRTPLTIFNASWTVDSGNCKAAGECAKTPLFPLTALANDNCTVTMNRPSRVNTAGWSSPDVVFNGRTYNGAAHVNGLIPAGAISFGFTETSFGWQICTGGPSLCGETCAAKAAVTCRPGMQGCGPSLLEDSFDCSAHTSRPYADAATCNDRHWVSLDLGSVTEVSSATLSGGCRTARHCGRGVAISTDGTTWTVVYAQVPGWSRAEGNSGITMTFGRQKARYVRVASSRSEGAARAQFMKLTLASKCEDDTTWTDVKYGSGYFQCHHMASRPLWCTLRTAYSVEAAKACPASCGLCTEPFTKITGTCHSDLLIDESTDSNYIETATACYLRCLSDSSCSHFEWEPARNCRRFSTCIRVQGGGGGVATAQTYSMPNLAQVSAAHDPVTLNFLWRGSFTARTSGTCQANPSSSWECKEAVAALGLAIQYDNNPTLDPNMEPFCYLKKDGYGYIFEWTTDHQPQGCETPDYTCICRESGESAVALYNLTVVDPKSFIFSLAITPSATADTVTLCLMPDAGRCRGKQRTLQALGASAADVQAAESTATINSGLPLRLGPQVVHYAVDWDGDGDKDLLLGRLSGELVYLENINGAFDVSSAVGIARSTSTKRCRQAWQSFSGDHLVDPFCGHWCCYTENIGDICYLEDNSGWANCQTDSAFGVSTGADQGLHPVPVDWDGDGDLDILAGTCIGKMKFFRNNGRGAVPPFTELTGNDNPFSTIPERVGGAECLYPDLADWDADGDLDLLLGRDSGVVEYYENELGTLILRTGDSNPLNHIHVEGRAVPSVADIDGDGDLDLIVGGQDGRLTYFNRAALGNLVSIGQLPYNVPSNLIPRAVDIDSDGLIDLLLADGESGQMRFFMSITDNTLREQLTSFNPFTGLEIERGAVPQAADWNGDGTFEFFVGGDSGNILHFESSQDATLKTVSSSHIQDLTGKPKPVQQIVDWNGDGRADLIVGRSDGEVLFHERLSDDSLAPGVALIPATGNSYASPHAVDWDGDGDMDLIVGDSGPSPPRTLQLAGFPNADWNTVYTEKREMDMLIEGFPVFVSDANWVIAVCTSDKRWFLFHNSSSTVWEENRNGNCLHQMAYWVQGLYITDRSLVGMQGLWQVHGSQTGSGTTEVPGGVRTVPITSEGNSAKPHCDVCNRASGAECNTCDLSETMLSTCAKELCQAQGYDTGLPVITESVPASACECQDTDNGATDLYGASCANYQAEWCGRFDDAIFTSTKLCCLCGGGFQTNATMIDSFLVKAECFQINVFTIQHEATIAGITPDLEPLGTIKYYERADNTSNTLTQKPPNARTNPFGSITTSNRPYPFVVDWDKDGYKDLVLGSASDEAHTLSSNGTADAPFCSLTYTACVWDSDTQTRCGNAFCRAAGYSWGEYADHRAPEELCNIGAGLTGTDGPPPAAVWHYNPVTNRMEESVPQIKISLTVQCRAAGAIRFFKQTLGGTLQELTNADNPFDGIRKTNFVAANIVDWDGDKEWEVIIGDSTFALQYFKTGTPCQNDQPCSGKGLCHPVLGTCGCIAGYKLDDCSSCDTSYYTERSSTASSSACLACPGVGSVGGVCKTRGLCNDDKSARELSGGSNSTVNFYIGTGLCACSPYYSGDCTVGECPAGMEPVIGNLSTFECTPCETGYFKDMAGNVACQPCAAGTYSPATGASVCTDCPAGRSQSRAGQDQCSQCLPGSASMIGSKTCTECQIGTHAKSEEMGACLPCPPGSWSDTAGARECTRCIAGEFSSGEMACQSCFQGSYSAAEGMANCTLCPAGTYSSTVGAASEDVCIACAEGKYSSMQGMEAEAACISCGVGPTAGATTMEGGATNQAQCIQPNFANFKCISGLTCTIYVSGNELQAELHKATITDGSFYYPSQASPNGQNYTWVFPLTTGGGTFDLKWCAGVHTTCLQNNEFQFELGMLEVAGPKELKAAVVCVRGRPCENNGPVEGVSLPSQSDLNMIQAQSTCGTGPKIAMHAFEAQPFAVVSGGNLTFGFGGPAVTVEPSTSYEVCWCAAVNGNECKTIFDYRTKITSLTVEGPRPGQEKQCYLGQDCDLAEIKGVNVKAGDRLMVLDRCGGEGRPVTGVPGDSIAEWASSTADGSTFKFLPVNDTGKKVLRSFPGIYRLCFCRALDSSMKCEKPEDFQADVGLFTAKGPYTDHNIGCFLGSDCTLEKIRGVGMENGDTVLIQKDGCSSAQDQPVPAGLPSVKTAGTESGTTYSLGSLTTVETGAYHICWRQSYGDTHGWSMGYLYVTCPAGAFRFRKGCEVCPLGHYCTGGTQFLLFQDDSKERCFDAGATTNSTGAKQATDCECAAGRYKGTTACQLCPVARYKDTIGNAAECPGVCPNGTTSRQGASSPDHCYSQVILGEQRLDEAEVFVLTGNITVQSTSCEPAEITRAQRELRKSIANMLQVLEFQVELTSTPHSSCQTSGTSAQGGGAQGGGALGQGGGPAARRMQSSSTPSTVTFRIIRANKAEVERMKQSLDFNLIQDELPDGIIVTVGPDALVIAGEKLQCPENMAFELGARPTSTDACLCSFGYFLEDTCEPCDTGYFKNSIGNQVCTQCARQRVGGKDITLGTLAKASTSSANCTCPEGYYSEGAGSPPTCLICPQHYYCEGGEHKAACPDGSVTLSAGAPSFDECVCAKGYKPLAGTRNATHRCEKCPNRVYKASEGDQDCTQQCPPNSNSFPGATKKEDCFCDFNYFYAPWTGSCLQCPPEGVTCKGGFVNGTLTHTEPESKKGYYLTRYAAAEKCGIDNTDGTGSVCRAGATYNNNESACTGHQTGVLCGACKHMTVRDLGDKPCKPCDPNLGDWVYVGSLLMDLGTKAVFGIFLGKQQMTAVTKTKKMDAIILRILLQWITAVSVLQSFSLPDLQLYDWSKEEAANEATAKQAVEVQEGKKEASSLQNLASGLNIKFEFPPEFQPIWNILVSVKGSIPSVQSPMESVECLVHRQFPTDDPKAAPGWLPLMIPAIYWFCFPISVILVVYILCLIFCKIVWPIAEWMAKRAKDKLEKLLLTMGASKPTVKKAMKGLNQKKVFDMLEDPASLKTADGLNHFLGKDVMVEVAAAAVMKKAGAQISSTIKELADGEDDLPAAKRETLKKVAASGVEGEHAFVTQMMYVMDPKEMGLALTDTKSMPPKIKAAIEKMEPAQLAKAVREAEFETKNSQTSKDVQVVVSAPGDEKVKKLSFEEEHHIFGIFRGSSFRIVFIDAFPLFLITLYSIWDVTTRRMLGLIQMKRILIVTETLSNGFEVPRLSGRWLYDTRLSVLSGAHLGAGLIGVGGLCFWSVGFLVALFLKLKRNKHDLPEIHMLMNYGYFYNGLEPDTYWWDVGAKKFDILCLYFVTFTEMFPDPKAKLIMYLGFAGIFWALHNVYHPFDDRQNKLADRLEGHGLTVRFVTLFMLQCLLILSADKVVNVVCAVIILVINFSFVAIAIFALLIEIPASQPDGGDWESRATRNVHGKFEDGGMKQGKKAIAKTLGGNSGNPVQKFAAKAAGLILGWIIGPLFDLMIKCAEILSAVRDNVGREVPHVVFNGPGRHFAITTPRRAKRPCHRKILASAFRTIYKLREEDQRSFLAQTIGAFLDHLMTNAECNMLPSNILDIFFALPKCLSIERAEEGEGLQPIHIRTARRICDVVGRTPVRCALSEGDLKTMRNTTVSELEGQPTAEDLNGAMIWLQRLNERETWDFLQTCCESTEVGTTQSEVTGTGHNAPLLSRPLGDSPATHNAMTPPYHSSEQVTFGLTQSTKSKL